MKDWDNYRLILALARKKTLRAAAEALNVNHATVSRKLAWLNQTHESPVFERKPVGYHITEYGKPLLYAAEEMESVVLSSERKHKALEPEEASGQVSISVSDPFIQFILSDNLAEFAKTYPKIELCIDASEQYVNLDRSEADVVVRSTNNPPEHLVGRRLFPYAVSYYAERKYFEETSPKDYCWIGRPEDSNTPDWILHTPFPQAPLTIRTTGYESRYLALLSGMGLSRAACFMADSTPELIRLPNATVFNALDLWVLTHPDLRHSPKIKVVMQYLIEAFSNKRALLMGEKPLD